MISTITVRISSFQDFNPLIHQHEYDSISTTKTLLGEIKLMVKIYASKNHGQTSPIYSILDLSGR